MTTLPRKCSMMRHSLILLAAPCLLATVLTAQSPAEGQDYTYTISTTQPWTDTGLDLQTGDSLQITTSPSVPDRHAVSGATACDPKGASGDTTQSTELPLPSAPTGALIARLHAQGAAPMLIGVSSELQIQEPSHLFLGVNAAGTAPCQGTFAVRVHRTQAGTPATVLPSTTSTPQAQTLATTSTTPSSSSGIQAASTSSTQSATTETTKTRGEQLKSQLSAAAQIFMSGQFGGNKSETNTAGSSNATSDSSSSGTASAPAPVLTLSNAPLDTQLRKSIDSLPRRINDQFKNLGDMVNFVIVGSEKNVQATLDAANWHVADTDNKKAVLNAVLQTYDKKDYLAMPMSTLYLFDRRQDYGYEQAEPIAMVASRHHFRIWKAPFTWQGHEVWVGAGTHDIGFAKDKRNSNVTHKIDPAVDGERDNIGSSLQKGGKTKSLTYYLPPDPVQDAKNATGDGYNSDGRLLVICLQ